MFYSILYQYYFLPYLDITFLKVLFSLNIKIYMHSPICTVIYKVTFKVILMTVWNSFRKAYIWYNLLKFRNKFYDCNYLLIFFFEWGRNCITLKSNTSSHWKLKYQSTRCSQKINSKYKSLFKILSQTIPKP